MERNALWLHLAGQRHSQTAENDRGRAETSNLHDHATSARSEAFGTAGAALCGAARLMDFIDVVSKVARQISLAGRLAGFSVQ